MHVKIIYCFFSLFFFSFVRITQKENKHSYVNEIIKSAVKKIEKQFPVMCVATGGSMPYDIVTIQLCFKCFQKGTIEKAREFEVIATKILIKEINKNKKIRPYLRNYPFEIKGSNISISFHNSDNSYSRDLAFASQANGYFFYSVPNAEDTKLIKIHKESYEEAIEQLKMKNETVRSLTFQ